MSCFLTIFRLRQEVVTNWNFACNSLFFRIGANAYKCLASQSYTITNSTISSAFQTASSPPTGIRLLKKERRLELAYENGLEISLPAELLRVCSPSADTRRVHAGRQRVVAGRRHVGIMSIEPVGNYAIRIHFDDLHSSGIFTWDYLASLGGPGRWPAMRDYLRRLRQAGLSRDPTGTATTAAATAARKRTAAGKDDSAERTAVAGVSAATAPPSGPRGGGGIRDAN